MKPFRVNTLILLYILDYVYLDKVKVNCMQFFSAYFFLCILLCYNIFCNMAQVYLHNRSCNDITLQYNAIHKQGLKVTINSNQKRKRQKQYIFVLSLSLTLNPTQTHTETCIHTKTAAFSFYFVPQWGKQKTEQTQREEVHLRNIISKYSHHSNMHVLYII